MDDTFKTEYLDANNTKFIKFSAAQDLFNGQYEYRCNYDLNIKYHNVKTSNKNFNALAERTSFHDKGLLSKSYKENERPEILKGINTEEEFDAFVEKECSTVLGKFNFMLQVFSVNLPKKIFEDALTGTFQLDTNHKVTNISFDDRKAEVDKISVYYDDETQYTVVLPQKVSDKDVSSQIPGHTLTYVKAYIQDWLEEDYEGTIEILNNIFGIDFTTLKGGYIK